MIGGLFEMRIFLSLFLPRRSPLSWTDDSFFQTSEFFRCARVFLSKGHRSFTIEIFAKNRVHTFFFIFPLSLSFCFLFRSGCIVNYCLHGSKSKFENCSFQFLSQIYFNIPNLDLD